MFNDFIMPRFSDTDALGHISNTALPHWFESSRHHIFKIFSADLDVNNWPLILAKVEIDFHAQLYYGEEVDVRTFISHVGNSSFVVYQQAWQKGIKCATGKATMVHFCYKTQKSKAIIGEVKERLLQHMYSE